MTLACTGTCSRRASAKTVHRRQGGAGTRIVRHIEEAANGPPAPAAQGEVGSGSKRAMRVSFQRGMGSQEPPTNLRAVAPEVRVRDLASRTL